MVKGPLAQKICIYCQCTIQIRFELPEVLCTARPGNGDRTIRKARVVLMSMYDLMTGKHRSLSGSQDAFVAKPQSKDDLPQPDPQRPSYPRRKGTSWPISFGHRSDHIYPTNLQGLCIRYHLLAVKQELYFTLNQTLRSIITSWAFLLYFEPSRIHISSPT
jgi:hypothetical protein